MDSLTTSPAPASRHDFPPVAEQLQTLMRGVEYGDDDLARAMQSELAERLEESRRSGRPLTVYVGIDPTGSDLTLGHTVPLRKLRQFQDLGHSAVFVIGDFTARIGDPSDKGAARRQLSEAEVRDHAADYIEQAFRVLDRTTTTIRFNGEWLGALDFPQIIDLASHFTVGQFLQRENFHLRFAAGDAIWLHEFFYALMQAYDALALGADVQIGGTEQLFNLMAGRKLQQAHGRPPQVPVTMPILVGTDGHLRMSKSTGNYIGIAEAPDEQFGKTMSLPDEAMANWFNLVTAMPAAEIDALMAEVTEGRSHPMDVKKRLAGEIVTLFHGPPAALSAALNFERTVQRGEVPDDMASLTLDRPRGLLDVLSAAGLVSSNSEARRLVEQGGVRIDGEPVADPGMVLEPGPERLLQAGKRRFVRLVAG